MPSYHPDGSGRDYGSIRGPNVTGTADKYERPGYALPAFPTVFFNDVQRKSPERQQMQSKKFATSQLMRDKSLSRSSLAITPQKGSGRDGQFRMAGTILLSR